MSATTQNQDSESESLELAKDAINYTLKRIREDANLRYHAGAFTETFDRLAKAHSAMTGISVKAIEIDVLTAKLTRKANGELIEAIKDILDSSESGNAEQIVTNIRHILGR
jgi:methionine synthase II (cobalamin-independent)